MPQAKRFIIRDRNNPEVYCEFFIAGTDKDNLAMLHNKGMEILVVSHAETVDIKGTSLESCDKPKLGAYPPLLSGLKI